MGNVTHFCLRVGNQKHGGDVDVWGYVEEVSEVAERCRIQEDWLNFC